MRLILTFGLFMIIPSFTAGQASLDEPEARRVIINEIAWMGSEVEGVNSKQWWRYEWIELYNAGNADVVLSGWTLELYRPSSSAGKDKLDFVIQLQSVIEKQGYFVAGASGKIENINVSYGSLMGKFANDGQLVLLKDASGNIIDTVDATSGWFAGENTAKLTMERRFPEKDSQEQENWGSSLRANGSLGGENTIFEKQAILNLDYQAKEVFAQKKSPIWASFFEIFSHKVFILAAALALGSSLSLVSLRQYLLRGVPLQ